MFYVIEGTKICNFADDTTPHSSCQNLKDAMTNVDCAILVEWFRYNFMTLNADKCHIIVFGHKNDLILLLGILIDFDLSFNDHTKMICKTASQKLSVIARMTDIISTEKREIVINVF